MKTCARCFNDPEHFSNAGRFSAIAETLPPAARSDAKPFLAHNAVGMLQSDPRTTLGYGRSCARSSLLS